MRKDYNLEKRQYVIGGLIVVICLIYIIRLLNLQVIDSQYKNQADSNAFLRKAIYPSRGIIYDRNGKVVVFNRPAYDVMMIPRDVTPFDTLEFCSSIGITIDQFHARIRDMKNRRLNPGYSKYAPQTFMTQLSSEDYGRMQEKMYRFPGFYIQKRILREYNYPCGANFLGNIREVSQADIDNDPYYARGDMTGDLGIEKSYEKYLRGRKGEEILIRDAVGRIQGKYDDGAHDTKAISGKNLKLSIDIGLQQFAESLMVNKIGAVVAIEPATGEILALVTSPSYDPALLVGRERGKNYAALNRDWRHPLLDRSVMGAYPPGSTFKPTQGLILLQEGIITTGTAYPCAHGYINSGLRLGCHGHASPIALKPALETSCNAFFCWGFKAMLDRRSKYGSAANAFEVWKNYLVSMGYGYRLGIDLPSENRGYLPNAGVYNKVYGDGRWGPNTIISVSIGQGEILATPLQIANLAATIANRGYFITPHIVKEIEDTVMPAKYLERHQPKISRTHYETVAEGMRMAVTGGTCRTANLPDIEVCGKTGTAQNSHGRDHSAFMGFAPYHNPQIAVAVYVENAGFGAAFGVPIGSLVIERYLKGSISPQRQHILQNMLHSATYTNRTDAKKQ